MPTHPTPVGESPVLIVTDCLNSPDYEYGMDYEAGSQFAAEERAGGEGRDVVTDHPFLALKKLLGDGSFYYSLDFNLTDRLQDRSVKPSFPWVLVFH